MRHLSGFCLSFCQIVMKVELRMARIIGQVLCTHLYLYLGLDIY
jgi:hypothetical protein